MIAEMMIKTKKDKINEIRSLTKIKSRDIRAIYTRKNKTRLILEQPLTPVLR